MIKNRYEFGNMRALNIIKTDKFKTSSVIINYICGLDEIRAGENALLSNVLCRASTNYPKMDILNKKLESLYGASLAASSSKRGDNQVITFSISFINDKYALNNEKISRECIKVLFDVLYNPLIQDNKFISEYFQGEKKNLIEEIKSEINDKRRYALDKCIKIMCSSEKFSVSRLGSTQNIEKIDECSLYKAYVKFIQDSVVEAYYVGSVNNEEEVIGEFRGQFNKLDKNNNTEGIAQTQIVTESCEVQYASEAMDVSQGKLVFGLRTAEVTAENKAAYMMMNEIFGGGVTSKLFMNVREKMSLCYYCSSMLYEMKSIMMVNAGIEFDKKDIAQKAILDELQNVKNGDFSSNDIKYALASLINEYRNIYDSLYSSASYDLSNKIRGFDLTPEDMIERLQKVTKNDIIKAANGVSLDTVFFLANNN